MNEFQPTHLWTLFSQYSYLTYLGHSYISSDIREPVPNFHGELRLGAIYVFSSVDLELVKLDRR